MKLIIIISMKKLILASQSPRRKELLEKCGIPFTCEPADIDETIDDSRDLSEEIKRLSLAKAAVILKSIRRQSSSAVTPSWQSMAECSASQKTETKPVKC